jgi:hypothetical protein
VAHITIRGVRVTPHDLKVQLALISCVLHMIECVFMWVHVFQCVGFACRQSVSRVFWAGGHDHAVGPWM